MAATFGDAAVTFGDTTKTFSGEYYEADAIFDVVAFCMDLIYSGVPGETKAVSYDGINIIGTAAIVVTSAEVSNIL